MLTLPVFLAQPVKPWMVVSLEALRNMSASVVTLLTFQLSTPVKASREDFSSLVSSVTNMPLSEVTSAVMSMPEPSKSMMLV